jgi:hypothetical protein
VHVLTRTDTPSDIAYSTPSTNNSPHSDSSIPSVQHHSSIEIDFGSSPISETPKEIKLHEFNEEFRCCWLGQNKGRCFSYYRDARGLALEETARRTLHKLNISAFLNTVDDARSIVFKEDYETAEVKFSVARNGFHYILGQDHWLTLVAKFEAILMHVAKQPSCGSTVAFRFLHKSLTFLNEIRHKYVCEDSEFDLGQVKQILILMRRLTMFWIDIVTKQKAAKDSATLLGSEHAHVLKLRRHLETREANWRRSTYEQYRSNKSYQNNFEQVSERLVKSTEHDAYWKRTVAIATYCEHVPDGEHAELLANAQTTTKTLTEAQEARAKHRSDNLLGAVISFGGDHERAECLLEETQQKRNVEICPENKIHQLLIYAEHKTRDRAWDIARHAMREVRNVWQATGDSIPEKLKRYFRPRIMTILRAISSCLAIDDTLTCRPTGRLDCQSSPMPGLESSAESGSSDSDFLDDEPRTPSPCLSVVSTVLRHTDSLQSPDSQLWDALDSPFPKTGKKLGDTLKELHLNEQTTANPVVPGPEIQSTHLPSAHSLDNLAIFAEVEGYLPWTGLHLLSLPDRLGLPPTSPEQESRHTRLRNEQSVLGTQQDTEMAQPNYDEASSPGNESLMNAWFNQPPSGNSAERHS